MTPKPPSASNTASAATSRPAPPRREEGSRMPTPCAQHCVPHALACSTPSLHTPRTYHAKHHFSQVMCQDGHATKPRRTSTKWCAGPVAMPSNTRHCVSAQALAPASNQWPTRLTHPRVQRIPMRRARASIEPTGRARSKCELLSGGCQQHK